MRKSKVITILNEVGQFVRGMFIPKGRTIIDKKYFQQSEHSLQDSAYLKKGFTLIEIVIVLVMSSILIGILFKVYTTTAYIALRIKHQKQLGVGVVTMQTVLQNIVDTHTIDYNALSGQTRNSTAGWIDTVPLLGENNEKSILSLNSSGQIIYTTYSGADELISASLLGTDIAFTGATFIVYPARDPKIDWCTGPKIQCFNQINHPGFWLLGDLYPIHYTQLTFPVHTFFSFLKK